MPKLATPQTCTGCSACANICPHNAISISPDSFGFLMPEVSKDKCVECKLCEKACPIVNKREDELKFAEADKAYALWSIPDRTKSSSGGAFSAVARYVLNRNGVVFGASWVDDFTCGHTFVECIDDLDKLRGSKYVQSDIGKTYRNIRKYLIGNRLVLFTGTPCQVAGLRSFLLKPYPNLICVDIVCHGVPSNDLFRNYISKLKKEFPKCSGAEKFEFRNRHAWGITPCVTVAKLKKIELTGISNIYMDAFDKSSIFRESCYDCRFNGLARVGDITIADFWGIGQQGIPFHHDVSKGVSLVLVNSDKGREILAGLEECFVAERPLQEAIKYNHNLIGSSKRPHNRGIVINSFNNPLMTLSDIDKECNIVGNGIGAKVRILLVG